MTEITQHKPEFVRCYCTGVGRARILEAIGVQGCRSVEELQQLTGVCGGCGSCRPELVELVAQLVAKQTPSSTPEPS